MTTRKLLVTGASGKQGGAVVKALLANPPPFPFEILALTRSPDSPSAKSLASNPQVTILEGDLDHPETVFEKAGGSEAVWGVFLVTVPSMKKGEEGKEEALGKGLIDAAIGNGVKHLVFSSVDRGKNADTDPTPIAHFISKFHIEQHLKEQVQGTETTYTILRPVAFMENMNGNLGKMFAAMWRNMGDGTGTTKLQLVATKDIGVFAALAFAGAEDDDYKNKAIALAGDDLSQVEGGNIFIDVIGRPMPRFYGFAGSVLQWMIPEIGTMFNWFVDVGYAADIDECKRLNPQMMNLEAWLHQESQHKR